MASFFMNNFACPGWLKKGKFFGFSLIVKQFPR